MLLGAHMSIAKEIYLAIERGVNIGCETIQIFVKNNRRWDAAPIPLERINKFKETRIKNKINPILSHNTYLVNLATTKEEILEKSLNCLLYEIRTSEELGLEYIVMHPGSHLDIGEDKGIEIISKNIRNLIYETEGFKIKILLETMAGQGTNIGYKFDQIKSMIELIDYPDRIGVCFDTCHSFAAGYDFRTEKEYEKMIDEFNSIIGLENLLVIHLNDSAFNLGSKKDRHEHIGMGKIGLDGFRNFINDKRFKNIPGILETPKDKEMKMDIRNLEILRSLID
ncbi:MAG: deoxyribonuclease IV [Candidatus Helarchaeota archaeon]